MTLRCFVAMAFDRHDVNEVYDGIIKPTLEAAGVRAICVDRVEHNDNINERILTELRRADFALADLTFARPSVYFEAGFAERSIPVVYTCRSDHFVPHDDDDWGQRRVHFHAQMKNIVRWNTPRDAVFRGRLEARISRVIRPLLQEVRAQESRARQKARFASLSQIEQRQRVLAIARSRLKQEGFRAVKPSKYSELWRKPAIRSYLHRLTGAPLFGVGDWMGSITRGQELAVAVVVVAPVCNAAVLESIDAVLAARPCYSVATRGARQTLAATKLNEDIYVLSFNTTRLGSLKRALVGFRVAEAGETVRSLELCQEVTVPAEAFPPGVDIGLRGTVEGGELVTFKARDAEVHSEWKRDTESTYRMVAEYTSWNTLLPVGRRSSGGRERLRVHRIPRVIRVHVFDHIEGDTGFKAAFGAFIDSTRSHGRGG